MIELFRDGKCIQRQERNNLVVTVGERFYTQSILPTSPAKKMQYLQLGKSSTAPVAGNTVLGTPIASTRKTANTAVASGKTALFVRLWGATSFSATGIKEAGIFSQRTSGSGTMLSRVVFTSTSKSLSDSFRISWKISAAAT